MHCRCMACDRPLAKLDPDMGGFIPGPHMPISVTTEPSRNNGVVVLVKDGMGGRAVGATKGPPPSQHSRSVVHTQSPRAGTTCALWMFPDVLEKLVKCFVGCTEHMGGPCQAEDPSCSSKIMCTNMQAVIARGSLRHCPIGCRPRIHDCGNLRPKSKDSKVKRYQKHVAESALFRLQGRCTA